MRCHRCPSYRRRSTCMTSRPTLVCLFQATAPPGPPRLPRKKKKTRNSNLHLLFGSVVSAAGGARAAAGGAMKKKQLEIETCMQCIASLQCSWDWQWVPCVCIHPIWPSDSDARSSVGMQTAAMRCWRLELLDQTSRRRPAGRPWLLVAGSVVVLVHAWIMDAWPVLKLTPGAEAQRSDRS